MVTRSTLIRYAVAAAAIVGVSVPVVSLASSPSSSPPAPAEQAPEMLIPPMISSLPSPTAEAFVSGARPDLIPPLIVGP